MTQRHQPANPPSRAAATRSAKAGKTLPVPLTDAEQKKVAGGVKQVVIDTPRGTW